ncbi:unnamed protein product [Adineta ricciae]|uniref:Uncharacterized protein n=1 Tax=Adineta ricciae TaxID=249248 RepID=A0A815EXM8_ADIRI|nr:unnamed protein product [Adineta ricciae]
MPLNLRLISLAGFTAIALALIITGGWISAWCIKVGDRFECYSLFQSDHTFSCLFKLIPTGIILCLIVSLLMFLILIIIQAKKEYQLVTRFVNILVLSIAIILIMIVLLQWFHLPTHTSKNIIIARIVGQTANHTGELVFGTISSNDPLYLAASDAQRQAFVSSRYNLNHGPNLFFASFVILLITLLAFVILHHIEFI